MSVKAFQNNSTQAIKTISLYFLKTPFKIITG